jgi:hypothetical protein
MPLTINIDAAVTVGRNGQLVDVRFLFGDEYERCSLPLDYWSIADYVSQWISALSLVIDSKVPAAMITSIHDPAIAANLVAWVLYPLNDGSVKIQQHLLMHDEFMRDHYTISHGLLLQREFVSGAGEAISEWTVSFTDLMVARTKLCHLDKRLPD